MDSRTAPRFRTVETIQFKARDRQICNDLHELAFADPLLSADYGESQGPTLNTPPPLKAPRSTTKAASYDTLARTPCLKPIRTRGFSLLELLMVISILTAITGLAVMGWGRLTRDTPDKAAREIAVQLDLARSLAVTGNTYVWVCFAESVPNSDQNKLLLSIVESANGRSDTTPSNLRILGRTSIFHGVEVGDHSVDQADALSDADLGSFTVRHGSSDLAATGVVRFSPLGEASVSKTMPSNRIEIPLQRTVVPDASPEVVVQIAGLSGTVFMKEP